MDDRTRKPRLCWALTAMLVTALGFGMAQDTRTASFYGGFQQEVLTPNTQEDDAVHISLSFRTLQESGLLFFTNSSRGYIAVLVHHSNKLQVVLRLDMNMSIVGYINGTDSSSEDTYRFGSMLDWQTVRFRLTSRTLDIQLEQGTYLNHTFSEPVGVQSVFFGGPESFFDPLFMHLSSPHYFVGCMKDISIDNRDIHIDSERYGISAGCCIAPRYSATCLTSTLTTLSFKVPSTHEDVDTLMVTFHVQLNNDEGVVLLVSTQDTAWVLHLEAGRLQLLANASGLVSLDCPGDFLVMGEWHQVELLFSPSRMSCTVNGVSPVAATFSPVLAWTSISLRLGGIDLPHNLVEALSKSQNPFMGCFRKLRLNGADIDPSLFSNATRAKAANQPALTNWSRLYSNVYSNVSELVVMEHTAEILSVDAIIPHLPQDQYGDDLTSLYQREIENAIHLEAFLGPLYGHLFIGNHSASVKSFEYQNLVSDDARKQVGYLHSGGENSTDVVAFRVWAGCNDQVLADIQLVLLIIIEERDDAPRITSSQSLHLAVGTRRTITADMLRVEDRVVTDPSQVLFFTGVVAVQDKNCSSCMEDVCVNCTRAGAFFRRGVTVKVFTQDEVNQGIIQFQHLAVFLTSPLIARFRVTVQGRLNGSIDAFLTIIPHPGHLNLTSNPESCLFLKEGGMALVESKHLTAVTDFEEQSPTITYDLLITPTYGMVQVWSPYYLQWQELFNSTTNSRSSPSSFPTSSFTQADVNAGQVKYVQSDSFEDDGFENFTFQLRSSNLSGPIGVLCINIWPDDLLFQPTISIQLHPLVVAKENGTATITRAVLNTTLDNVDYLIHDLDDEIDVQQLGMVYTLVEAPSYGSLELGVVILVAGDNFTYNDIISQLLIYKHAGTEHHRDSFTFYAEASSTAYLPIKAPNLTANLTLNINITATNNYQPVLTQVENIRPYEGCWVAITITNINVTDRDKPPSPLKIILRRRKKDEPIGMFVLRSDPTRRINQFYMQDVLDGNVLYMHRLNRSASLHYKQGIKLQHLNSDIRKRLDIKVIPLDLVVAVSLPPNSSCIASLDAEQGPLQFYFNSSMFSIVPSDDHGHNFNFIPNINVSINSTTGLIFKQTRVMFSQLSSVPVSQFQFQEVGKIWYMLNNKSRNHEDLLDLEFSYGHSRPVLLSLRVCIRPLLVPLHISVSQMTLTHGRMGHITMEHLSVTSSRPGDDGALLFHVREGPRYGSLTDIMSDSAVGMLSQFTLTQLRNGVVVYNHYNHTSADEDQIHFQVCSEVDCLDEVVLSIQIIVMNMTVNNTIVSVLEGSKYFFSPSDFNVQTAPGFTRIKVIMSRPPLHGVVNINTSAGFIISATYFDLDDIDKGHFFYKNDGEENTRDNFGVRVEAENPESGAVQFLDFIMWIDIKPVNDWPPEIVSSRNQVLVVVERGSVLITTKYLSAHDYDSHNNDDDLVWSLQVNAFYGYIYLDRDPGFSNQSIKEWTEGDIKNRRLYYRNTQSWLDSREFLIISVSDGNKSVIVQLIVRIVAVDIQPNATLDFSVDEGETSRITYQHLHYTAVNDDTLNNTNFLITIKDMPSCGQLLLDGMSLHTNSSFTQDQIGTEQLMYAHDHSNTVGDNFTVIVSVPTKKNGAKEFSFHITIRPVNDDAPIVFIHNRLFVVELEEVLINSSIMTIVDEDAKGVKDNDLIECKLVEKLRSGRLEKRRFEHRIDYIENFTKFDLESNFLWYKHLSSPDLRPDNLIFNITDGINHQQQIYNLSIIILPFIVPVSLNALTVTENEIADITKEELLVAHDFLKTTLGVITVLENSGPSHGDLINHITGQRVQSFTTDDIASGSIFYHHNGAENHVDSFMFVYEALDPAGYNRRSNNETFSIVISPVDDLPPVINNNPSILNLWEKETVLLTEREFNVTDGDTSPSKLNFTVHIVDLELYVAYMNDTSKFILWFTQEALRAHRVVVVHKNGPQGKINYNVTDGKRLDQGLVKIFAKSLNLDCDTNRWRIEVNYLESIELNTSNIHCITTDDDNINREITYAFFQNQSLGHFEMDSLVVTSFNSTVLRDGLVRYIHTETGYWLERETLNMSASSYLASPRDDLPLVVYVQYPQPPPNSEVAVNRKVNLTEGGSRCLNASILDARNLRYRLWLELNSSEVSPGELEVLYKVVKEPKHGNLTRYGMVSTTFTQRDLNNVSAVCYTHDDSETSEDNISLSVQMIFANGTALPDVDHREQLLLHITPLNDQLPVLKTNHEKTVVENFTSSLLPSDLQLKDGDTLPHQLIFRLISIPRNVHLLLNGSIMAANSSFSQENIDLHQVTLQPYHMGSGSFQFKYTDSAHVSPDMKEFRVMVVAHTLALLHTRDITYMQQNTRHRTVITSKHIDTHTNALASHTVFTVVHSPIHGYIQMGNREVQVFTQKEVNSEQVYYLTRAGAQHHNDNFTLNVTNTNITLPLVVMKVRILVRGNVKEHISMDFSGDPTLLASPLPGDALVLNELERTINKPPTIELEKKPRFGHLEMQVVLSKTRRRRSSHEISSFRYEELQQGWIVYVWDYTESLTNITVTDSIEFLVLAEGYQPGEAVIALAINTPQGLTSPNPSAHPSSSVELPSLLRATGPPSTTNDNDFPVYTLVPILGIIFFLVVLIVVVVVFCLTQQKHIKLKLVPSGTHRTPNLTSPWPASPTLHPGLAMPYELDPSGTLSEEEHHYSSETSSGFSEPDISFHETSAQSYTTHHRHHPSPSPAGYRHPPAPPRSRMRSNVSITFSSQHSTTSEVSLEDEGDRTHNFNSLSLPRYEAQTFATVPAQLPVRPASHAAVSCPGGIVAEDGSNSGRGYQGEKEELARQQHQGASELDCHHQPPHHQHEQVRNSECLEEEYKEDEKKDWTQGAVLPDFNDHLHNLFQPINPVLKKEEYWV